MGPHQLGRRQRQPLGERHIGVVVAAEQRQEARVSSPGMLCGPRMVAPRPSWIGCGRPLAEPAPAPDFCCVLSINISPLVLFVLSMSRSSLLRVGSCRLGAASPPKVQACLACPPPCARCQSPALRPHEGATRKMSSSVGAAAPWSRRAMCSGASAPCASLRTPCRAAAGSRL